MEVLQQGWLDYAIIAVYMIAVVGIGFFFSKEDSAESYLLGGRNMPFFAIGLSCMMSLLSSISIVMVPGEIFNNGFTLFFLAPILGIWLPLPYFFLFTRFYFKLGSFTPYEYLEYRYSPAVRMLVAISAFYSRILYLGMVLYTTSKIFEGAYDWKPWFTILLVGVIGVAYTVMGGMKAVVWTDVIQFFVLGGGMIVTVVVLINNIDGGAVEAVACAFREGHGVPQLKDPTFYTITPYVRLLFFLMLWNSLIGPLTSAASDQINVQRLLSTRNWREAFKSQLISTISGFLCMCMLYFIGFAIFTYFFQHPDPALGPNDGDKAFFRFIATKLPAPMPGIFMAAMLAAIMSTLDSGINSMATVWLKEFHVKFINRNPTPKQEVSISRMATFVVGAFAIMLGMAIYLSGERLKQSVAEVGTIFGILGAATLPAFLFAVLSSRANVRLIWGYTFFAFGETLGKIWWYAASRDAVIAWKADPSVGMGWGGPLPLWYLLLPLLVGTVLCLPYLVKALRRSLWIKGTALVGLAVLGWALTIGVWYYFSNTLITDVPRDKSFAFFLPISFIASFIILWVCPKQPREKYQGLTLGTINEEILARKAD